MKPNRKKRCIRNLSLGLAAVILAGGFLSSQSRVAYAGEVFLSVQKIRDEVMQTEAESFRILEIADRKFQGEVNADGTISQLSLGEEEIGYLIGGQEPYETLYGKLYQYSRELSDISWLTASGTSPVSPTIDAGKLENIKNSYASLVDSVNGVFADPDQKLIADSMVNVQDAPLKKVEAVSYHPNPEEYEECLRFVSEKTGAGGFLVEDPQGAYVKVQDTYYYAGALDENINVILELENKKDASLSDNDLGEGSVSGNEIKDPGSVSDNEIDKGDSTTPEGGTGNEGNSQPEGGLGNEGNSQPEGGTGNEGNSQPEGGTGNEGNSQPEGGTGNEGNSQPEGGTGNEGNSQPEGGTGNEGNSQPEGGTGNEGNSQPEGGLGNEGNSQPEGGAGNEGNSQPEGESANPAPSQSVAGEKSYGTDRNENGKEESLVAGIEGFGTQIYALSTLPQMQRYSFYDVLPEGKTGIAVTTDDSQVTGDVAKIAAVYEFTFLGIENNEWFKQYVFGLEKEPDLQNGEKDCQDMNIEVITCTPDSAELKQELEQADLVYWNADTVNLTGSAADISIEDAILLLEAITGNKHLPMIINDLAFGALNPDTGSVDNTVNKLLHILYQENVKEIYELNGFGDPTTWTNGIDTDHDITEMECWSKLHAGLTDAYLNKGHFVRDNLYVINHSLYSVKNGEKLYETLSEGATPEESDAIAKGFEEVDYRVEQEAYERQQAGAATWPMDGKRTPALAIQTILTYTSAPVVIEKSQITVLELQPCYSFDYVDNVDAFKEKFLPEDSAAEVKIVGMTTAEFCGKLEDINVSYDMIYLGSNTDKMNRIRVTDEDYCTAYNDFEMYGIVYSHIGDLCVISSHSGLLNENEDDVYRYSGNDILQEQKKDFLEFLESGAPIVLEDDFFLWDEQGNITAISSGALTNRTDHTPVKINDTARGVNNIPRNGILDSSTYLYQFLKEAVGNEGIAYGEQGWSWKNRKYQNLLTVGELEKGNGKDDFSQWLNQPKMSLHLISQPTEYNYTTKKVGNYHVIADSSYLQKEGDGYYLTYEFYISSLASVDINNTFYKVSLYIDTNMDGKYSARTEELSGSNFEVTNMETGEKVGRDQLKTGVYYQVRRALPYDAVGALPWKLVVENTKNSAVRTAVTGITAVRMPEKQHIRVLQLYQKNVKQGEPSIAENMKDPENVWSVLLNNVPDFEVQITSVDVEAYLNGTITENLENYDMLIVGFADSYQVKTKQSAARLQEIIEYAQSGKCVLFSHDNTNWYNGKDQNEKLNMFIRDLTGLDRYGTTLFRITDQDKYRKNIVKNGKNVTAASSEELINTIFAPLGMEYKRDVAFAINTDQTVMDSRTQGLTYSGNEHDRNKNPKALISFEGKQYTDHYRYLNFGGIAESTWKMDSGDIAHEVEKVNQGAITEYPYRLDDKISIAPTHAQYYQLDLESDRDQDGEGDVVVWYTISNSKKGNDNDIYDYSPRDVRNNYYIYNRGNVTYTGMGHQTIQNEEEIKLFINTMIAAYRVSIQSPTIHVIEGNGDDTIKSFDAIPMDSILETTVQHYPVYFKIEDKNMISDAARKILVKLYLEGGTDPLVIEDGTIMVEDKTPDADWQVYETATGSLMLPDENGYYELKEGTEYFVNVPLTEGTAKNLSEYKSLELYLSAKTLITKENQNSESAVVYTSFQLTQINLFDLD